MIRSGQVTVTTAGTAVQAGTDSALREYWIRARAANTGDIYIGNNGSDSVAATTGLALSKTDAPILVRCKLSELWVDAASNGDKLTWLVSIP